MTPLTSLALRRTLVLLGIALVGLALRAVRLDLISFRYDMADALFRAREAVHGAFPFTGITNSLGFRNPAGLIWLILPPVVVSPRPEVATVWAALLQLTALWPLARLGRRLAPGAWWVAPLLYACLPSSIWAGRSVWAQNLMPMFAAWGVLGLVEATSPHRTGRDRRGLAAALGVGAIAYSALVHVSGVLYLAVALVYLAACQGRRPLKRSAVLLTLAVVGLVVVAALPSALDWWHVRTSPPQAVPEHIAKFNRLQPPPLPLLERWRSTLAGLFDGFSSAAASGGAETLLPATHWSILAERIADFAMVVVALLGLVLMVKSPEPRRGIARRRLFMAWLFVPVAIGPVLLQRVNSTYFAPALPILLLACAMVVERISWRSVRILMTCTASAVWIAYFLCVTAAVDRERYVGVGSYYIPLDDQRAVARKLADMGYYRNDLRHISGGWFQYPYDYLLGEELGKYTKKVTWARPLRTVMIEDLPLRAKLSKAMARFTEQRATARHRNVVIVPFASSAEANAFLDQMILQKDPE